MFLKLKQKIINMLFRSEDSEKLSLPLKYNEAEDLNIVIHKLRSYPEWKQYEEKLVSKLFASYRGLRNSSTMEQLSFYQGAIAELESILLIPKAVRMKQKILGKQLAKEEKNDRKRQEKLGNSYGRVI